MNVDIISENCFATENAEFIANAREDVPALIAEIDLLKTALEGLGEAVEIYSEMPLNEAMELLIKITQEDSQ